MKRIIVLIKEKLMDIVDFFIYNPFGIRSFWERVTGTIEYAVFIWQHHCYREWDYGYLYDLIEFKLKRIGKQLKKDSFVADSNERYLEIQAALDLLDEYNKIENGDYNTDNVDVIKRIYKRQQIAWEQFHDALKEHAQKWWS